MIEICLAAALELINTIVDHQHFTELRH